MPEDSLLDPARLRECSELVGLRIDPNRVVCLAKPDHVACLAAVGAFANGAGGSLILGATLADGGPVIAQVPGVEAQAVEELLALIARGLDPPVEDLLSVRRIPTADGRHLCVVSVRQSPSPPHIDTELGTIPLHAAGRVQIVRSRALLERLIAKGRTANERAERLIEAMAERLMLAHHGYFGIGILACLRTPSADPFLWAREKPEQFASADDPFVRDWDFRAEMTRVRPGEVELRLEREVTGILRVNRAGCVAVAEIRRRPPGDVLGSSVELEARLTAMLATICRILGRAEAPVIVPRLFSEGLRSCRLVINSKPYTESVASAIDMVQASGATGDPMDLTYQRELCREFLRHLCAPFHLEPRDDAIAAS